MENASKALIIAGAILLSILLISLGLIVYNQAKETIGSVNLSQQEIEAFNSKFSSFEGTNVSGAKVNQLIQTVIASNQQAIDDSTNAYVKFESKATGQTFTIEVKKTKKEVGQDDENKKEIEVEVVDVPKSKVIPGKTYTVNFGYTNSRVSEITVQ